MRTRFGSSAPSAPMGLLSAAMRVRRFLVQGAIPDLGAEGAEVPNLSKLEALLLCVPVGVYLVEQRGSDKIVWRISEGEPEDEALAPAASWPWALAPAPLKPPASEDFLRGGNSAERIAKNLEGASAIRQKSRAMSRRVA